MSSGFRLYIDGNKCTVRDAHGVSEHRFDKNMGVLGLIRVHRARTRPSGGWLKRIFSRESRQIEPQPRVPDTDADRERGVVVLGFLPSEYHDFTERPWTLTFPYVSTTCSVHKPMTEKTTVDAVVKLHYRQLRGEVPRRVR